jgi:hypothetical protein
MKNLIEQQKNIVIPNQTNLNQQTKIVLLTFLTTIIPTTLIFILFKLRTNLSLDLLTRDPLVITNGRFYIGMISNIGILFWCACAAICLYSYALLRKHNRSREISKFLGFSGLFTSFLMLDDLFMLHENFHYRLGINYLVFLIYSVILLVFSVKSIKVIKKTEFVILLAAMGFFSLSIVYDSFESNNLPIFIEDLFKFLGITTWFTYFLRLCWRELNSIIRLSSSHEVF